MVAQPPHARAERRRRALHRAVSHRHFLPGLRVCVSVSECEKTHTYIRIQRSYAYMKDAPLRFPSFQSCPLIPHTLTTIPYHRTQTATPPPASSPSQCCSCPSPSRPPDPSPASSSPPTPCVDTYIRFCVYDMPYIAAGNTSFHPSPHMAESPTEALHNTNLRAYIYRNAAHPCVSACPCPSGVALWATPSARC